MLSTKHGGTVKGEGSLVPTPFPPISDSLGHTQLIDKDPGVKTARGKDFFSLT